MSHSKKNRLALIHVAPQPIISNYRIDKGMKVLELGCGTGDMWKNRESLIGVC